MRKRTIAIGDIHGCALALQAVLAAIEPRSEDTIVTLGDYLDRGPDSRGVIEQLVALPKQCQVVPLLGNHEIMFESVLRESPLATSWLRYGGVQTMQSYGGSIDNIPQTHLDFLANLQRFYETQTHFFIHANYLPNFPLAEQPEFVAFWEHLSDPIPARHQNGKTAIVGHTSQPTGEILNLGHIICIDTCCHGTGWLTALDVDSGEVWQADKHGKLRKS